MNMNAISKYLQVFKKPNANQTVLENIGVMQNRLVLQGSGFESRAVACFFEACFFEACIFEMANLVVVILSASTHV